MTGFEPAASCSQSRRATNCATPGYSVFYPAGRILPNVARYQLRHTPIVIKLWSCKWSNLWSNTFLTAFSFSEPPEIRTVEGFSVVFAFARCEHRLCSQIKRATNCAIPGYLILNHYSTKFVRLKDFSVCGHLCGQDHFCAVFGNRWKSRKCRCHKALRRFASPYPGYRHGTPKPGAIPASLYPDIQLLSLYHGEGRKAKFFLAAVIYVL